ncbi:MAG: ABC transporter permease [Burkholderiales bacterium]|nr:ABC transporter permease [Burkholderiales bacterium]
MDIDQPIRHVDAVAFQFSRIKKRIFRKKYLKIYVGGSIFLALLFASLLAPIIAPHDPAKLDLTLKLLRAFESEDFILGTDNLGRDLLSRIIYGSRISLLIGVVSVLFAATLGALLGAISAYFGKYVDELIMKVVEIFLAFPFLLLSIVIMAFLGPGLTNIIIALVLSRWVQFCRLVRGEVLSIKGRDHVVAAKALGAKDMYIIVRHILPYTMPSLIVMCTFEVALVIIYESSLSFLGLGVPASVPTWGTMLAEGRTYMMAAPWLSVFPGLAIFVTVLGINLLGDGLRDVLDPRMRGR